MYNAFCISLIILCFSKFHESVSAVNLKIKVWKQRSKFPSTVHLHYLYDYCGPHFSVSTLLFENIFTRPTSCLNVGLKCEKKVKKSIVSHLRTFIYLLADNSYRLVFFIVSLSIFSQFYFIYLFLTIPGKKIPYWIFDAVVRK